MRVIVKEKQFDIIKKFILEAGPNIDNTAKANLGRSLLNFYKQLSINKFIEFGLRSGTKIVLKCVKASNNVFEFEIAKDDNGAIKNWDKLTLKINIGKQGQTNTDLYNNNQNIIKPSKGKNGFTIVFTGSNKEGKSNNVNFNDITKVSQTTEPKQEPKQEEPKTSGDTEQPDASGDAEQSEASDKLVKKADRALTSIQDDPLLKKAFYEQPGLMKLFFAELQNKKAVGKGIITVLDLLQKYTTKKMKEYFIEDRDVTIVFGENYNVKYGKNDEYSQLFSKNVEYPMLVMRHELAKGVNLKSKKSFKFDDANTISLILTLDEFKNEEQDEFYCELSFYVEEQDENNEIKKNRYDVENEIIIKVIRGDKSLGYNVKTEQK